jgi:predicted neutral ceramidase superfamily lipid hydrolase
MQFEIKRSGFPINIGEIEFFFGTTVEELTRFFDVQDEVEEKIAPLMKKREKLVIDQENITKSDAQSLIEISNELNAIQYDALLGDGSYEKIYSKYQDAVQLFDLFDPIAENVAEAIENDAKEREDKLAERKANMLKKKALKNKKKKK